MRLSPHLLLSLALSCALVACGDDGGGGSSTSNGTSSTSNGTSDDLVATSNGTGPITNCSQGCVGEGPIRVAPAELKLLVLGGKAENTLTFINNGTNAVHVSAEVWGPQKGEFSLTCDGISTPAGETARFDVASGVNIRCDFLWKPEMFDEYRGVIKVRYTEMDAASTSGGFDVSIVGEPYY